MLLITSQKVLLRSVHTSMADEIEKVAASAQQHISTTAERQHQQQQQPQ
jgi:hypothetical protein